MNINKKSILKSATRHFFIMIGACVIVSLCLYIASHYLSFRLHPKAYRDIIRSIIIIYTLFFIATTIFALFLNHNIVGKVKGEEKFNKKEYFLKVTPYEIIGVLFSLITIVNSIMMLTGIDVPKEGVFAYVHLIIRLGIITLIVTLIYFRDIKEQLKRFSPKYLSLTNILYAPRKNAFISISKAFTNVSILYCLTMITFQGAFNSLGGRSFYLSLLIVWGVISIVRIAILGFKGKQVEYIRDSYRKYWD